MESLKEHAAPIIISLAVISVSMVGIIWGMVIKRLDRLDKKLDDYASQQAECQRMLPLTFLTKEEWSRWVSSLEMDRRDKWEEWRVTVAKLFDKIDNHRHK